MKMFKTKRVIALVLTLLILFATTACSNTTTTPSEEPSKTPTDSEQTAGQPVDVLFSTHQVGSSNYTISAGLATVWQDYLPEGSSIDIQPTSPGVMGAPYLLSRERQILPLLTVSCKMGI